MTDGSVRIERLAIRLRGQPASWSQGLADRLPSALLHELRTGTEATGGTAPSRLRLQPEASAGSAERQIARGLAAAITAAAKGRGGGER